MQAVRVYVHEACMSLLLLMRERACSKLHVIHARDFPYSMKGPWNFV